MAETRWSLGAGLRAACASDPGRIRSNNEDVAYSDPDHGVFLVVDGVGGHVAGELAARTAVEVITRRLARETDSPADRVRQAIALANNEIYRLASEDATLRGMTCVLTLALVKDGHTTIGHVGDSRLYKLRGRVLRKMTHDHSPVGEREDAGDLSELDAMRHPRRNEVYRDVGSEPHEPDDRDFIEIVEEPFEPDAALLMCSDGLTDLVPSHVISHLVEQAAGDPHAVVGLLIDAANEAGGKDNVTVIYVEGPAVAPADSTHGAVAPGNGQARMAPTGHQRPPASAPRPGEPVASGSGWGRVLVAGPIFFLIGAMAGIAGWIAVGSERFWPEVSTASPRTLVVGASAALQFHSIAQALVEARPGDTIRLEVGEYAEQVVLGDGIHLEAAESRRAVVRDSPNPERTWTPLIVAGRNSRIKGLRLATRASSAVAIGLDVRKGGVELDDLELMGPMEMAVHIGGATDVTLKASSILVLNGVGVDVRSSQRVRVIHNLIEQTAGSTGIPAIRIDGDQMPTLVGNIIVSRAAEPIVGLSPAARSQFARLNVVAPDRSSLSPVVGPPATQRPRAR